MPAIIGASKVTIRYQVTIPEKVRKKMNLKMGDVLAFYEDGNKIYIANKV